MDYVKLRSFEEYQDFMKPIRNERFRLEKKIFKEFNESKQDFILGFCKICQKATKFKLALNKKGTLNLRGSLVCEHCNLSNRKRFMLSYLKELSQSSDSILSVFMYEQVTKNFKFAKEIKNINLVGSEFLGHEKKPGQIIENIRNEDAMNLSFEDNSFDVIVSNEVYEHVPDIEKALNEAFRVLKNSGILLISIPFFIKSMKSILRATMKNGKILHLVPPIYHENPIAEKEGSLVFYDYGWDFLKFLLSSGFKDVYMLGYYDILYGHLGDALNFIFVGQKAHSKT